jgi:hypothetical protein
MAKQTVCDFCESSEPLTPATGMYELIVKKVTKRYDGLPVYLDSSSYDVCGVCMAKIRLLSPKAFKGKNE